MSELAYNVNGEPFEVPSNMAAWRVRRLKPKGAPEVVYGRDGLPLFLPMDAGIEDLRREASTEGRYRLDPVDDHNRSLPTPHAGYVCVHSIEREPAPAPPALPVAAIQADTTAQLVNALLESQKQHTEMARMYVSQFPVLVNALSGIVRSAGDAGLPARVPLVIPVAPEVKPPEPAGDAEDGADDEDDDEDDEDDDLEEIEIVESASEPEWNWPKLAATALERFSPQIDLLLGQLPALGARLGARRATRADVESPESATGEPATDPAAHLAAIRAALTPKEAAAAMALANELSMTDKLEYLQTLRGMSVPAAVAYVRGELAKRARNTTHGAADEPSGSDLNLSDAEIDAHIDAIRAALTPEEGETVRVMLEELVFEHRLIWIETLCRMSVPEGVAFLRKKLAEAQGDARARGKAEPRIVRTPSAAPSRVTPEAAPVQPAAPRPSAPVKPRRDGRRVAGSPAPSASSPTTPTATTDGAPTTGLGLASPTTQAHLAAIQSALTADEVAAVRTYLAALPMAERSAWISSLLTLPVPEAVARIRAQRIADRAGAASLPDATTEPPAAPAATGPAPRNLAVPTSATTPPPSHQVAVPRDEIPAPAPTAPALASPAAEAPAAKTSPDAAPRTPPGAIETNAHTHLLAIEQSLTAGERFLVHATVAQMSPDAREVLLDKLVAGSVPEGAAILRAEIRELTAQKPPLAMPAEAAPVIGPPEPDERQRLEDAETREGTETFDDAEELGEEDEQPDHAHSEDHDPADDDEASEVPDDQASDDQASNDERPVERRERADRATSGRSAARAPAAFPSEGLPMLAPETVTQFKAIDAALTLAERLRVYELGARLSPAELRAWITELTALPVPDAIAKIRAALVAADSASHPAAKGGVS